MVWQHCLVVSVGLASGRAPCAEEMCESEGCFICRRLEEESFGVRLSVLANESNNGQSTPPSSQDCHCIECCVVLPSLLQEFRPMLPECCTRPDHDRKHPINETWLRRLAEVLRTRSNMNPSGQDEPTSWTSLKSPHENGRCALGDLKSVAGRLSNVLLVSPVLKSSRIHSPSIPGERRRHALPLAP